MSSLTIHFELKLKKTLSLKCCLVVERCKVLLKFIVTQSFSSFLPQATGLINVPCYNTIFYPLCFSASSFNLSALSWTFFSKERPWTRQALLRISSTDGISPPPSGHNNRPAVRYAKSDDANCSNADDAASLFCAFVAFTNDF